ncbi:MAG: hypothetical protein ABI474_07220 [Actinomycetota bacterium]
MFISAQFGQGSPAAGVVVLDGAGLDGAGLEDEALEGDGPEVDGLPDEVDGADEAAIGAPHVSQ